MTLLIVIGLLLSPLVVVAFCLLLDHRNAITVPHAPLCCNVLESPACGVTPDDSRFWNAAVLLDHRRVCACDESKRPRWCVDAVQELGGPEVCEARYGSCRLEEAVEEAVDFENRCEQDRVVVRIGSGRFLLDRATGQLLGREQD